MRCFSIPFKPYCSKTAKRDTYSNTTDAPHSAIAKLRRDMDFNILTPMRQHLMNNRSLKSSLESGGP